MKIVQVVPWFSLGDGIGNIIFSLNEIIRKKGVEGKIFAQTINSKTVPENTASTINKLESLNEEDILISHVGSDSYLNEYVKSLACKKIMMYHNITPAHFFAEYNSVAQKSCMKGIEEVEGLKNTFDMVLTPSNFNKKDLLNMGYSCPINILPCIVPFADYKKAPSEKTIKQYSDNCTNIIFVGRIAPHKKHEDVIKAFFEYQRHFNRNSRLVFVGSSTGFENYEIRLKDYIRKLGVKNVIFTGHIKFNEILAWYHLADLFLCQSEHEGFCIPLVEAMFFRIPIVAHDSSAIAETLGHGAIVLKEKHSLETAAVMNRILSDNELKNAIVENQCKRLSDFSYEKIQSLFWQYISEFLPS